MNMGNPFKRNSAYNIFINKSVPKSSKVRNKINTVRMKQNNASANLFDFLESSQNTYIGTSFKGYKSNGEIPTILFDVGIPYTEPEIWHTFGSLTLKQFSDKWYMDSASLYSLDEIKKTSTKVYNRVLCNYNLFRLLCRSLGIDAKSDGRGGTFFFGDRSNMLREGGTFICKQPYLLTKPAIKPFIHYRRQIS